MAYLMSSLSPYANMLSETTSGFDMVAELVNESTGSATIQSTEINRQDDTMNPEINFGTLGEINMLAAEAAAPFDPIESERKVKELIGETVNKAFDALRAEFKADVLQDMRGLMKSQ